MKLLIIGGAGYVGTILRPALEAAHDCYHLDLKPIPGVAADHQIVADVNDAHALSLAVYQMDVVLYLAMGIAPATELRHGSHDVDFAFDVNTKGYYRVVSQAMRDGIKCVVYASSLSVYRSIRRGFVLLDENEPVTATDAYGLTKHLGEEINNVFGTTNKDATFLSLRLMWPRNEKDWPGNEYKSGERWCPTGPSDLRRLFLAAVDCRVLGAHTVQATGDLEERVYLHTRVHQLLGWKPEGK